MEGGNSLIHPIDSGNNPYIKHLMKLKKDSTYRKEVKKVLLEGKQWIEEIINTLDNFIVLSTSTALLDRYEKGVLLSSALGKKLSELESGDIFLVEAPLPEPRSLKSLSRILVFDGISDPGNLGTLLRTALALDWKGVFFLPNCCDPFNGKALRASKGALFRLRYGKGNWSDLQSEFLAKKWVVLGADLKGEIPNEKNSSNIALVLGNEGEGLSSESKRFCKKVSIPISQEMESLNVASAGAILMYLLKPTVQDQR